MSLLFIKENSYQRYLHHSSIKGSAYCLCLFIENKMLKRRKEFIIYLADQEKFVAAIIQRLLVKKKLVYSFNEVDSW